MTSEELDSRQKAYEKARSFFAVLGFAPLLLIYICVHTRYLQPYLPESRSGQLVVLLLLPFSWFGLIMLLHRWLGPIRHGLICPGCDRAMLDRTIVGAATPVHCKHCGAQVTSS